MQRKLRQFWKIPAQSEHDTIRKMNKHTFSDRDRILEHEPLFKYCNYRIGGPADLFFDAKNIEELEKIIIEAHRLKIPFRVIGQGSNMLFRDEGYRGLIIRNSTQNVSIDKDGSNRENLHLIVDSGLLMSQFIRVIHEKFSVYLPSVEEFQGLPGTVGGAVYGNAGCFGKEFSELVIAIEVLDCTQEKPIRKILKKGELKFRYRTSSLKDMDEKKKNGQSNIVILRVFLDIPLKDTQPKSILKLRASKQPPGYSCGSFFKNPEGRKSAGQLIEEAGCKGIQVGGAKVSEKHGNFFLNTGNATAKDLINLSEIVKKRVHEKFGIKLEEEVRIV